MNNLIKNQYFLYILVLTTFADSYPVFPSSYKPLFLWVLILIFPIALSKKIKFQTGVKFILFSFVYMIVMGIITAKFKYKNFEGVLDSGITIILFFIAYNSYTFIFQRVKFFKLKKAISNVGNFLILTGYLEMFSYYRILPKEIKYFLNIVLTGSYSSRFKLIASEASWAAMTLLFFFVFYFISKKYINALLVSILIIASFSTQGILSLLIYIFIFTIKRYRLKAIKYIVLIFLVCILLFISAKKVLLIYNMQNLYFARRLFVISELNISEMLYLDDSVFVRIGYPLIAIKIGLENLCNFALGIGAGNYRLEFPKMMSSEFPNYYKTSKETMYLITTLNATSKNIITRIFCEGGIIGLSLFVNGYYKVYQNAKYYNKNNLILLMVLYLQFDSYTYLMFPMILAMVQVYDMKRKKVVRIKKGEFKCKY